MRKSVFTGVAATAAAAALLLGGCSSGGTTTEQSPEADTQSPDAGTSTDAGADGALVIWADETRMAAVKAAADEFTEATGNTVDLVQKNFEDIRADFTAQVPTGHGPDITIGAHDWLGELTANGVVAPIELGDKTSEFNETAISAFTFDGQLYGLPYAVENIALIRNVDLAPDAPANWDDVLSMGEAAGTAYKFLIQMNGEDGDPYTFYPLQTSFGSSVFVQNEDGSFTNELNLAAGGDEFAQFLADNGPQGTDLFNPDRTYDIVVDAFARGESPFLVGGPWMLESIAAGGVVENIAIDPVPSAGGQPAAPFAGVQGFYLSAQAANPLIAQDFMVNYLTSEDLQFAMYEAGDRPPALTAAADRAAEDPITAGFIAAGVDAQPMPSIPEMNAVWTPWGRTEAQIISGSVNPQEAWARMIEEVQASIDG